MFQLLYGVAYDDEYLPAGRLEQDIALMQAAGINLVHIAESTWSTHEPQPSGVIGAACGVSYSLFVEPKSVGLKGDPFGVGAQHNTIDGWAELLTPTTATVLASYDHAHWGKYAAITSNRYGAGTATYIGCMTSGPIMARVLEQAVKEAGLWGADQTLPFPLITRSGVNEAGKVVRYYLNYADERVFSYPHGDGTELLGGAQVRRGDQRTLDGWGVMIIEEE